MTPIIHVYMDPQQFTFENSKGETFTLRTIVHITEEKGRWMIADIGNLAGNKLAPDAICIPLFETSPALTKNSKLEILQAFLWYGIGKSLSSYFFSPLIRPKVILHGADRFQDLLKGYERDIFQTIAENAGARSVVFAETSNSRA